jgi:hypothetical protein
MDLKKDWLKLEATFVKRRGLFSAEMRCFLAGDGGTVKSIKDIF